MDTFLRATATQNWITLLLLGCLILLATVKFFYAQQFVDALKLVGADRFIATRSKGSYFFQPMTLVLFGIQLIVTSLLIYLIYCYSKNLAIPDNPLIYVYILLGYTSFEIIKIVIERTLSYLLDIHTKMRPYFYKKINIKNWIGLFLLVGCFVAVYTPEKSHLIPYILIGLAILLYSLYSIWLLRSYSEPVLRFPFYFILYFCTLEIVPYFILYKYVIVL